MKSWNEMLENYKKRVLTPVNLEKLLKKVEFDVDISEEKEDIFFPEIKEQLEESYSKLISAIDDKFIQILNNWGEKYNIEELKKVNKNTPLETFSILCCEYGVREIETGNILDGIVVSVECEFPGSAEVVYAIKEGKYYIV